MSSFFDKISTLVNAQVNELLGKNPRSPLARIRLNPEEAEKDPRRSAQSLRERLDEAIDYEDVLQAKINGLMREAMELDAEVDACVQRGDHFGGQRLQGQLNIKQQQLTIAESELRDHRAVTRHLMHEMNDLETALDNQERQQRDQAAGGERQPRSTRIPVEGAASAASTIVDGVADKLNEAREGIETLITGEKAASERPRGGTKDRIVIVDEEPDPRPPKPHRQDREKMNRRLSRLSKPADDES